MLRYGLLAPAGTPRPIVDRINVELRKIVGSADMLDRLAKEGSDPWRRRRRSTPLTWYARTNSGAR